MARDRSTADEAWSGDIIGIPNHGTIRLGETFSEGEDLRFTGIPSFAPEMFRLARIGNPLKIKQLQKGLQQLAEEGATQLFRPISGSDMILGAVGALQFDVVAHRLEARIRRAGHLRELQLLDRPLDRRRSGRTAPAVRPL